MKYIIKITLLGILAILFIDTVGSITSNKLNFSYSYLSPISFLIYTSIAFWVTREINRKTGITIAALLGLIDATIGWKISIALGANIENATIEITLMTWTFTALFAAGIAALFGLLGAWLATKIGNNKNGQP